MTAVDRDGVEYPRITQRQLEQALAWMRRQAEDISPAATLGEKVIEQVIEQEETPAE